MTEDFHLEMMEGQLWDASLEVTLPGGARRDLLLALATLQEPTPSETFFEKEASRDDVAELFSPPRLVPVARARGLKASISIDIQTGCDLRKTQERRENRALFRRRRPRYLTASPPCDQYSSLQNLNAGQIPIAVRARRRQIADVLYGHAIDCLEDQLARDDHGVLEHPIGAQSWSTARGRQFVQRNGIKCTRSHMCRFNYRARRKKLPAKKVTRWATSSHGIYSALD